MTRRMMKELVSTEGKKFYRLSRWISVQWLQVTERHPLWYYAEKDTQEGNKRWVECFRWNDTLYAMGQFMRFNTPFVHDAEPILIDGKEKIWLAGFDANEYFDPIMIEIHDDCEHVRVYKEGRNG